MYVTCCRDGQTWIHMNVGNKEKIISWNILIIKANKMHNFSNLFYKVIYMFGQVHCPSSGVSQYCIHTISICHASRQPTKLAWQIPVACIQCWDTPDDGHGPVRNMSNTLSNKSEKLCILLAFIIRIYHDARSSECQIYHGSYTDLIQIVLWRQLINGKRMRCMKPTAGLKTL